MAQVLASLTMNPEQPDAVSAYFETALPLIEAAGGKVIQRLELGDQLVGSARGSLLLLVQYPSRDAIERVFASEAYQKIIPIRDIAFLHYNVSIINSVEFADSA